MDVIFYQYGRCVLSAMTGRKEEQSYIDIPVWMDICT